MRSNKRTHVGRRKLPRRSAVGAQPGETVAAGDVVVHGGRGFQFCPCVGQHTNGKHPGEQKSRTCCFPARYHSFNFSSPRTHGTVSVLSAHPRSSHLFPSECSLRGRIKRRNGARDGGGVDCIDYLVGRDENVCRVQAQNELGKLNIGGSDVRKIQTDGTTNRHKRKQRKCSAVWRCPILSTGVNLAPRWISQPRPVTL